MRGEQAKFACYRHDFGYYLRDIQWSKDFPASKVAWVAAKMAADMELKFNRKQVAKYSFIGRIYAALYFRAVRVGAHKYALPIEELPVPPTWIAMQNLTAFFEEPFTPRARRVLTLWAKVLHAG